MVLLFLTKVVLLFKVICIIGLLIPQKHQFEDNKIRFKRGLLKIHFITNKPNDCYWWHYANCVGKVNSHNPFIKSKYNNIRKDLLFSPIDFNNQQRCIQGYIKYYPCSISNNRYVFLYNNLPIPNNFIHNYVVVQQVVPANNIFLKKHCNNLVENNSIVNKGIFCTNAVKQEKTKCHVTAHRTSGPDKSLTKLSEPSNPILFDLPSYYHLKFCNRNEQYKIRETHSEVKPLKCSNTILDCSLEPLNKNPNTIKQNTMKHHVFSSTEMTSTETASTGKIPITTNSNRSFNKTKITPTYTKRKNVTTKSKARKLQPSVMRKKVKQPNRTIFETILHRGKQFLNLS